MVVDELKSSRCVADKKTSATNEIAIDKGF